MLCNLPEIWTTLNSKHDVSDMGNVRRKQDLNVLHRYKVGAGYAGVTMHGIARKVHGWVLRSFIPRPSPMFTMCDHIDRDRMNPQLVNLRWSNTVLNAMNKHGVSGYTTNTYLGRKFYYPNLKLLGMRYTFPHETDIIHARAIYEYWQRRSFALIEALCRRNLHWKLQRKIIE